MLKNMSEEMKTALIIVLFAILCSALSFFGFIYHLAELYSMGINYIPFEERSNLNTALGIVATWPSVALVFGALLFWYLFCRVIDLFRGEGFRKNVRYANFDSFFEKGMEFYFVISITVFVFFPFSYLLAKNKGASSGIEEIRKISSNDFSTVILTNGDVLTPGKLVVCSDHFCGFHDGVTPRTIAIGSILEIRTPKK